MADTKKQSLDNALKQIEKEYGEGSIMKLGSQETVDVPSISTGSFNLDKALGIGGLLWKDYLKFQQQQLKSLLM